MPRRVCEVYVNAYVYMPTRMCNGPTTNKLAPDPDPSTTGEERAEASQSKVT